MTTENTLGRKAKEGRIARDKRKARELGEERFVMAGREADRVIQQLGREPKAAERLCIEHVSFLNARIRALRAWTCIGKQTTRPGS